MKGEELESQGTENRERETKNWFVAVMFYSRLAIA
jgi:hypothetical protein